MTLSFLDNSGRYFSRPWSVSQKERLIWTIWDHFVNIIFLTTVIGY